MPHPIMMSFDLRDGLPRRWMLHLLMEKNCALNRILDPPLILSTCVIFTVQCLCAKFTRQSIIFN